MIRHNAYIQHSFKHAPHLEGGSTKFKFQLSVRYPLPSRGHEDGNRSQGWHLI